MTKTTDKLQLQKADVKPVTVRSNIKAGLRIIIVVPQPPLTC